MKSEDMHQFEGPHAFVQWKGICLDAYCKCGEMFHICDTTFAYYLQCPYCKTIYATGWYVELIETDEVKEDHICLRTEILDKYEYEDYLEKQNDPS